MKEFEKITITHGPSIELLVNNPTELRLIDKGAHGAVFMLSKEKCVKIYADANNAELEANSYKLGQDSDIMPKLYEAGNNYIIMEFIPGISLWKYLSEKKEISFSVTEKLVSLIKEMKRLGFTRRDSSLRHIIVTADGKMKVIDLVYAYVRNDIIPDKVLSELMKLGLLEKFLKHVKKIDSQLYIEWKSAKPKYVK
jgi:predicted Ser/Thr protein kinase